MEYKNTNVAKIVAFVLIASILVESITAAPLTDDHTQATRKPRNTKDPNHRKRGPGDKKLLGGTFEGINETSWQNPCNSIEWIPGLGSEQNYDESYSIFKDTVLRINSSLASKDRINTSDISTWEKFNNNTYSFLPTRPAGLAHKWHQHTQIYVASLTVLYKFQLRQDIESNNNTISMELKDILDRAQELLCEIEQFVNATSNRDGKHPPEWYTKKQMSKIVTLKPKKNLNNMFVKARFQQYIERLYKRTVHFNKEKNLEVKSLRSITPPTTLKPRKGRKHRNGRRRSTTVRPSGEMVQTGKAFIIMTKRSRPNTRTTRLPGQKKRNRVNQSLQ